MYKMDLGYSKCFLLFSLLPTRSGRASAGAQGTSVRLPFPACSWRTWPAVPDLPVAGATKTHHPCPTRQLLHNLVMNHTYIRSNRLGLRHYSCTQHRNTSLHQQHPSYTHNTILQYITCDITLASKFVYIFSNMFRIIQRFLPLTPFGSFNFHH